MPRSSNVFIAYAADTKPLAEELTLALQREGIQTWADFKDLKPGQLWKDEIENALQNAQSFVILVSPESKMTRWAEVEWRLALTNAWSDPQKMLIPVVVGENEVPPFLSDWVPLRIDPGAQSGRWTSDILQALRSAPNRSIPRAGVHEKQKRTDRLNEMASALEDVRNA